MASQPDPRSVSTASTPETMDLRGRAAVLTGAASGFGLEMAKIAALRGMHVVMCDVQAGALRRSAEEIAALAQGHGGEVMVQTVDVADGHAVRQMARHVREAFGAPALVFNNAGVAAGGLVWETDDKDWSWVLGVNLMGVVHGVQAFAPMMLEAAAADPAWRGHIVNTASMAGLVNAPAMGVYNVSKHGVVSLSETLYHDLALVTTQVRAHVLCPYFVPTGINDSERNRPAHLAAGAPTLSQRLAQAQTQQAVSRGKVSAADVAARVFESMETGAFYIFSHPKALGGVRMRAQDILELRNPTDPYAERPEMTERLREGLKGGGA